MRHYLLSWSSIETNQFFREPSFVLWIRSLKKDICSICAYVDADSEKGAWEKVAKNFPDCKPLYCCDMADVIIEDGTMYFPPYKSKVFSDCISGPPEERFLINCFVLSVAKK